MSMLTKFAVTNYRNFGSRVELDLSNPKSYEFNTYAVSDGVVKNGILYGPNGSGKSNLSLALFDIEYHLAPLKAKKLDYYDNFVYAGNTKANVKFEYEFRFSRDIVRYIYEKDRAGLLQSETLYYNDKEVFTSASGVVTIHNEFFPDCESIQNGMSTNANNVSVINFILAYYPLPDNHFLIRLRDFVNNMLWFRGLERREFIGIETQSNGSIDEFIIRKGLVEDFASFLYEVSGQRFDFIPTKDGDNVLFYKVKGVPLIFNGTVSTGTRSLELLYFWIKRMGAASFVFIDEFDAFYHFRLSYNVCRQLFGLPCQLFLSSHNTYLMTNELLRPDCNFIISESGVKTLAECTDKELRFGHNIEKIYRAGAFNE